MVLAPASLTRFLSRRTTCPCLLPTKPRESSGLDIPHKPSAHPGDLSVYPFHQGQRIPVPFRDFETHAVRPLPPAPLERAGERQESARRGPRDTSKQRRGLPPPPFLAVVRLAQYHSFHTAVHDQYRGVRETRIRHHRQGVARMKIQRRDNFGCVQPCQRLRRHFSNACDPGARRNPASCQEPFSQAEYVIAQRLYGGLHGEHAVLTDEAAGQRKGSASGSALDSAFGIHFADVRSAAHPSTPFTSCLPAPCRL